jgi:hypothetical protein
MCSDSAGVYAAFARATGIAHRPLNIQRGPRVVDGVFHIQNVNAYDSRLKGWMRRFHGVAPQYLENYLGWRRMLERQKTAITPEYGASLHAVRACESAGRQATTLRTQRPRCVLRWAKR